MGHPVMHHYRTHSMRIFHLVIPLLLVGCPMSDSKTPQQRAEEQFREAERSPQGRIAGDFAKLLVAGDFDGAAAMLTPELRATNSPESLAADFARMIDYGDGPADEVQPVTILEDWPDRQPGDLGWAYVAISGPAFNEAVTVVVTEAGRIRQIEWGRP
jgi:hypothetical protein